MSNINPIKNRLFPKSMDKRQFVKSIQKIPSSLLVKNEKMAKSGFWNFTLPAYKGMLIKDNKPNDHLVCPNAGKCRGFCYASAGTYMFKQAVVKHSQILNLVHNNPTLFKKMMIDEISRKKSCKVVRIHDSGDFYDENYYLVWLSIMKALPHVKFYAYTKQVSMFNKLKALKFIPKNFTYVFSFGGKEDQLIDVNTDRHAKVFNNDKELEESEYTSVMENDIPASNPSVKKIRIVLHGVFWIMDRHKKVGLL